MRSVANRVQTDKFFPAASAHVICSARREEGLEKEGTFPSSSWIDIFEPSAAKDSAQYNRLD